MKRGGFIFVLMMMLVFQSVLPAAAENKEGRNWQDESIYYLMIDRFYNGDQTNDKDVDMHDQGSFHGGDFQGIVNQLDYIEDMGFTVVSLTPIFANDDKGYHGFRVIDFYHTEEHFGTIAQFKQLVDAIHQRDMKVIVDFDLYHVAAAHPWALDDSKKDWFAGAERDGLLTLNLAHAEVKDEMIDAAKWWIKETNIDGYRLLSAGDVPVAFWHDFIGEMKKLNEDVYLLADAMNSDSEKSSVPFDAEFTGWMNYGLNSELRKTFVQPDISFNELFTSLEKYEKAEQNIYALANFMDHEQMVRFTNDLIAQNEHPGPRWKQALTFLYTIPGVPIVYYGSEIALSGGKGMENHEQMNFRTDKDLYDYISKIGDLRKKLPSLTKGTLEVLYEKNGAAVYKRVYENETTVVAINNTTKNQIIAIPVEDLADDKELRGLLNGDLVRSTAGEYVIALDRDMSEIYVLSEKSSINLSYILAMTAVLLSFTIFMILVWRRSKANQQQ